MNFSVGIETIGCGGPKVESIEHSSHVTSTYALEARTRSVYPRHIQFRRFQYTQGEFCEGVGHLAPAPQILR